MIILDTNVLSELMRPKPSPRVVDLGCEATSNGTSSSITEAEIFYGIELLTKGKRRERGCWPRRRLCQPYFTTLDHHPFWVQTTD